MIMDSVRKDRKIGIVINSNNQIFSNGIIQNAYFLFDCLERIGLKCQFLSTESSPTTFGYRDLTIKPISLNELEFDASEFHTIITVTNGITQDEYDMMKKNKVFVISFICGNQLLYHLEEFVRGSVVPGVCTYIGKGVCCDEVWAIPSLEYSLDYISIIRDKPVFLAPHLWAPTFLIADAARRKKKETDLYFDCLTHVGKEIEVLILESNIHLSKASWLPIVSCEKLNKEDDSLIETVYAFNFPDHAHSYKMVGDLSINKKLRKFKRLAMPEIMLHFNEKSSFPIIVSHQTQVTLNYLFYEALYFGWPLVHNSPALEDCGYYYPENDIVACADAIKYAYNHHNKNIDLYIERAKAYLARVDPANETVGKKINGLINSGISKLLK